MDHNELKNLSMIGINDQQLTDLVMFGRQVASTALAYYVAITEKGIDKNSAVTLTASFQAAYIAMLTTMYGPKTGD